MPDAPKNGGTYVIQNKATGKQLGLTNSSMVGVFKEQHIVPRDREAVWELEFVKVADSLHCYRSRTTGPFPWSDLADPDSDFGRLGSDAERRVYAQLPATKMILITPAVCASVPAGTRSSKQSYMRLLTSRQRDETAC
jgi:hypothetical protein